MKKNTEEEMKKKRAKNSTFFEMSFVKQTWNKQFNLLRMEFPTVSTATSMICIEMMIKNNVGQFQ